MENVIILLWVLIVICYVGFGINFVVKIEGFQLILFKLKPTRSSKFIFFLLWPIWGMEVINLGLAKTQEIQKENPPHENEANL